MSAEWLKHSNMKCSINVQHKNFHFFSNNESINSPLLPNLNIDTLPSLPTAINRQSLKTGGRKSELTSAATDFAILGDSSPIDFNNVSKSLNRSESSTIVCLGIHRVNDREELLRLRALRFGYGAARSSAGVDDEEIRVQGDEMEQLGDPIGRSELVKNVIVGAMGVERRMRINCDEVNTMIGGVAIRDG